MAGRKKKEKIDHIGESLGVEMELHVEQDPVEMADYEVVEDDVYYPPATNIVPAEIKPREEKPLEDMSHKEVQDYAEKNIRKVIDKAIQAVDELADLSGDSSSPRAFEVLANMVKTVVDANKQLIDISNKRAQAELPPSPGVHTGDVINNNLIIAGSDDVDDVIERLAAKMTVVKQE